jgi:hypothetical protein
MSENQMAKADHVDQSPARYHLVGAVPVTAVGCLSSTNTPDFPGLESFAGESYHTVGIC